MISLLTPSRERPKRLIQMWKSALDTAGNPQEIELIVRCDEDDPTLNSYKTFFNSSHKSHVKYIITKRHAIVGQMVNECYSECSGDILFFGNDDLIFKTKNWDIITEDTFNSIPDKIILLSVYDGLHDPKSKKVTLVFVHKNWAISLGYICNPLIFWSCGFMGDTAKCINRYISKEDIFIDHVHKCKYKYLDDDTYHAKYLGKRNLTKLLRNNLQSTTRNDILQQDVKKLNIFIDNYYKNILQSKHDKLRNILKKEIYNKSCSNRCKSPLTSTVANLIIHNDPHIIEYINTYFNIYSDIIKNQEIHVNALSSRLILWAFNMNISPAEIKDIDRERWIVLIDRILSIILHMSTYTYGRMILCESIAHRCADMLYVFGMYEKEMEEKYNEAYSIALKLNRFKQMHSSMYYQYIAWKNIGNKTKAKQCAKIVADISFPVTFAPWIKKKKECEQYLFSQDFS